MRRLFPTVAAVLLALLAGEPVYRAACEAVCGSATSASERQASGALSSSGCHLHGAAGLATARGNLEGLPAACAHDDLLDNAALASASGTGRHLADGLTAPPFFVSAADHSRWAAAPGT